LARCLPSPRDSVMSISLDFGEEFGSSYNKEETITVTVEEGREKLELLKTSVQGFDDVLGGGMMQTEFFVIAGDPGTGKTILTQQAALNWLRQNKRVMVILGETTAVKYVNTYGPFTDELVKYNREGQLLLVPMWLLRKRYCSDCEKFDWWQKVKATVSAIRDSSVDIVVIDSITTYFEGVPSMGRKVVSSLSSELSRLGVTTIATAQVGGGDAAVYGGYGVFHSADGVAVFRRVTDRYGYVHIVVNILKHRGMNHSRLVHPVIITPDKGVIILSNYRVYSYRGDFQLYKIDTTTSSIPIQEMKALQGVERAKAVEYNKEGQSSGDTSETVSEPTESEKQAESENRESDTSDAAEMVEVDL